jgi:hypothetical protein
VPIPTLCPSHSCIAASFGRVFVFFLLLFALDLKSEIKRFKNVLSTLIGKTVGTGSIKVSRTVLPGWDPD